MKLKKYFLQFYNKVGDLIEKGGDYLFGKEVWIMLWWLESEEDYQALLDRIIEHTQNKVRVQLKLPQICTDPITNRVMDCEELVRQKMVKRLMKMRQSTL